MANPNFLFLNAETPDTWRTVAFLNQNSTAKKIAFIFPLANGSDSTTKANYKNHILPLIKSFYRVYDASAEIKWDNNSDNIVIKGVEWPCYFYLISELTVTNINTICSILSELGMNNYLYIISNSPSTSPSGERTLYNRFKNNSTIANGFCFLSCATFRQLTPQGTAGTNYTIHTNPNLIDDSGIAWIGLINRNCNTYFITNDIETMMWKLMSLAGTIDNQSITMIPAFKFHEDYTIFKTATTNADILSTSFPSPVDSGEKDKIINQTGSTYALLAGRVEAQNDILISDTKNFIVNWVIKTTSSLATIKNNVVTMINNSNNYWANGFDFYKVLGLDTSNNTLVFLLDLAEQMYTIGNTNVIKIPVLLNEAACAKKTIDQFIRIVNVAS